MNINIREMLASDLNGVAEIHKKSFSRQNNSLEWIECNHRAFPRIMIYVAEYGSELAGYIQWIQKSGFRRECVLELEQMAVLEEFRCNGVGKALISESMLALKSYLGAKGVSIKNVIVTTRDDNHAKKLYESTLGAKEEYVIKQLFSGNESVLIARDVKI